MDRPQLLLVEDDPDLREAISVTLSLGGVPFQAFESAEDALPWPLSANRRGVAARAGAHRACAGVVL